MAEKTLDQVNETLEILNAQLGDFTPYKLAMVDPKEIEHVQKNARFMSKTVFDQLISNIKSDGNLASLPFCWRKRNGKYVSLSGNHRVDAAVDAGTEGILILFTDAKMNRDEQIAVQLSHNAIVGADNPVVLAELWQEIDDLQFKMYSGLDEEILETIEDVTLIMPKEESVRMETLELFFITSELDMIEDTVKKLGQPGMSKRRMAAPIKQFDKFYDTLLEFKSTAGLINTSTAFALLTQIALDWISEHVEDEQEA